MRKLLFLSALLLFKTCSNIVPPLEAQNTVTVTASQIHNGGSGLLPAGTILFQPVNAAGQNISYQIGATGPSFTAPTVCPITNGAITGPVCTLPNVSVSNPQNFCFAVTVKNTSNVVVLGGPGQPYSCVQPIINSSWCSAGVCDFDNYYPTIPNNVYVLQLPPPTPTSLGGIYSSLCPTGYAVNGYNVQGIAQCTPATGGGGGVWGTITGTLANQTDLYAYLLTLSPLNSPSFTGIPSVPTPLLSDNSTTIPNTSWVQSQGYAPLASPAFTGAPTAPTPLTNDSSTKLATTAWVNLQGYSSGSGNVTGPGSSTNNGIVLWNGTNGRTLADAGFGFPLAAVHIGTLAAGSNGLVNSATTDTTNASNISSGTLPSARLPNPTVSTLGGIQSFGVVANQFVTGLSTTGILTTAQPSCANLSNSSPSCATDATNASNITTGTLNAARMGTGYPLNFTASLIGAWGSSGSPIVFGTHQAYWQMGDFGASPVNGVLYISDSASTSTDISSNVLFDSGASSRHSPFAVAQGGTPELIVCWESGDNGKTLIGNAITCAQESTTPLAKFTVTTASTAGSATHTVERLYAASASYTGTMAEWNNATAPSSAWNFFKACASATGGNGACSPGGTVVASLDGTGMFTGNFSGNLTGNIVSFPSPQVFPVTSSISDLVLGVTNSNPCCSLAAGSIWQLTNSFNGFDHLVYFDTSGGYQIPIIANDTPCNMVNGCSGTGATALVNGPTFINPNIGNATGVSLTLNLTTGDQMDLQAGTVTPYIQAVPQAGHIKTGYGSDNRFQLSNNNGAFSDVALFSDALTAVYNHSGTQSVAAHAVQDAGTLSGGTLAVTFSSSAVFTSSSTYSCTAGDTTTTANNVKVTYTSGTSVTFSGTGTDSFRYLCVGN